VRTRGVIQILSMVLILSSMLFGATKNNNSISIEGKIGSKVNYDIMPIGFAGRLNFPFLTDAAGWGIEAGVMLITSWEDTLDLSTSPDPDDTILYDLWTKNGTDINFHIGPEFRYMFKLNEKIGISTAIGAGLLANISAFDETKKAFDPPPLYSISETPTEVAFYIKPRLSFHIKKVYLAYEYFGGTESLDHAVCLGITF